MLANLHFFLQQSDKVQISFLKVDIGITTRFNITNFYHKNFCNRRFDLATWRFVLTWPYTRSDFIPVASDHRSWLKSQLHNCIFLNVWDPCYKLYPTLHLLIINSERRRNVFIHENKTAILNTEHNIITFTNKSYTFQCAQQ